MRSDDAPIVASAGRRTRSVGRNASRAVARNRRWPPGVTNDGIWFQAAQQATSIFAAVVRFEAGARNHWHSHSGGQLLHVIEGEGWVQVRGQEPERIRLHDTVAADPGEEHWHGAGGHSPMSHLAVAAGETRWLEESPPPPD